MSGAPSVTRCGMIPMLVWYAGSLDSCLQVHSNECQLANLYNCFVYIAGHVGGSFSSGTGRIWMSDVQCTGSERVLANCAASLNASYSCTHSQDVGVQCAPGTHSSALELLLKRGLPCPLLAPFREGGLII